MSVTRRYDHAAAWDVVLPLTDDIRAIVAQAHARRSVLPDYDDGAAMVYLVESLTTYQGEVLQDVTAWCLARLRRELLYKGDRATDALTRSILQGTIGEIADATLPAASVRQTTVAVDGVAGEDLANRATRGPETVSAMSECLSPLENRVVGLRMAGMSHRRIASKVGCKPSTVARIIGQGAAKAKKGRMPSEKISRKSSGINEMPNP